jgi:tetratricopeptide (TPR) repeat protein
MTAPAEAIAQGRQARKEGKLSLARAHYAEAAKILHEQKDTLAYAHAIRHIADMYQQECSLTEAKPLYEEALELYRSNLGTILLDLANTVRPYALLNESLGNADFARTLWEEARQLYTSLRLHVGVCECEDHILRLNALDPLAGPPD